MKKITRQFIVTAIFERVRTLRPRASRRPPRTDHTVVAGRKYVETYVNYVHFAERLAGLTAGSPATAHAEHAH